MKKFKLNSTFFNSTGLSFLEMIVAAGLMGILSVGGMKLMEGQKQISRDTVQKFDVVHILNQMRVILGKEINCVETFKNLTNVCNSPVDNITNLQQYLRNSLGGGSYKTAYSEGTTIGDIIIESLTPTGQCVNVTDEVDAGVENIYVWTGLKIVFDKAEVGRQKDTNKISKLIKIKVKLSEDRTQVDSCTSAQAESSDYWYQSVDGISYSEGYVGVGNPDPEHSLDIFSPTGEGTLAISGSPIGNYATSLFMENVSNFEAGSGIGMRAYIFNNGDTTDDYHDDFILDSEGTVDAGTKFEIDSQTGKVTIGGTNPTGGFTTYVNDVSGSSRLLIENTDPAGLPQIQTSFDGRFATLSQSGLATNASSFCINFNGACNFMMSVPGAPETTFTGDMSLLNSGNLTITAGQLTVKEIISAIGLTAGNINVTVGNINVIGPLGAVANSGDSRASYFLVPSDRNLKKEIIPIKNAKKILDMLHGVKFSWKSSGEESYGLIAQEVEKIIPFAVETNEKKIKALNYDSLNSYIVEAFKEQDYKISSLEERLDRSKMEIEKLKNILKKIENESEIDEK